MDERVHKDTSLPSFMNELGQTLGEEALREGVEGTMESFDPGSDGISGIVKDHGRQLLAGSQTPSGLGVLGKDSKIHRQSITVTRVPLAVVEYEYKGINYSMGLHLNANAESKLVYDESPIDEARADLRSDIDDLYEQGRLEEALYNINKQTAIHRAEWNQNNEPLDVTYDWSDPDNPTSDHFEKRRQW